MTGFITNTVYFQLFDRQMKLNRKIEIHLLIILLIRTGLTYTLKTDQAD